jgi:hypothetical protein
MKSVNRSALGSNRNLSAGLKSGEYGGRKTASKRPHGIGFSLCQEALSQMRRSRGRSKKEPFSASGIVARHAISVINQGSTKVQVKNNSISEDIHGSRYMMILRFSKNQYGGFRRALFYETNGSTRGQATCPAVLYHKLLRTILRYGSLKSVSSCVRSILIEVFFEIENSIE